MRKKFLDVAMIVVSMAVICCVSAFAEMPYPDDLPPVPSQVDGYSYIITRLNDGRFYLVYTDEGASMYFDSSFVRIVSPDLTASKGTYFLSGSSWSVGSSFEKVPLVDYQVTSAGTLYYANYDVYDLEGNLVYAGAPAPPPPPPDPYENFWSDLKEVGTGVLGWAGNVASTITAEPVLLFTVGIFILGAAIGIFRRLLVRG